MKNLLEILVEKRGIFASLRRNTIKLIQISSLCFLVYF